MMDTDVKKRRAKRQPVAPKKKEGKPAAPEINLGAFSTQELRDLARTVEAEIKRRRAEDRKNALREVKDLAASYGLTVDEVLGAGVRNRRPSAPAQGKYRNPDNPNQTWVGRGRKPGWLVELLAQGKTLGELEV